MNCFDEHVGIGEAHSKLILVGEHMVVYNKPAIAIPFPLMIQAKISKKPGEIAISSKFYSGSLLEIPDLMRGISECIKGSFELCHRSMEGVQIEITSDIPIGRGLGSSAASATAIVRGIYNYFERDLPRTELFSLVEQAESYAHGKPSGIDMMVVASEEPIYYQRQVGATSLVLSKPLQVVVADTGKFGNTKKAVNHVKDVGLQNINLLQQTMDQIEEIVLKAKKALLTGNAELLGNLLTMNHTRLQQLGVSDPLLDQLVDAAIRSGALGAKLTGGGMGGCVIALAKDIRSARIIANNLMNEGAKMVWHFSTDSKELWAYDKE